ncbi:MAG: LacI family DNA-binding transcriptional regulator [Ferruginibacter sp.]
MPEGRETTIYDIAKLLNVSVATVSRGLQNSPAIHQDTRKRVIEAATLLGYRSNVVATSLRRGQTHTIGLLVPRLNGHFMSSLLAGIEGAASKKGFDIIIAQSLDDVEKEKEKAAILFNKRIDGLLIFPYYKNEYLDYLDPFFLRKIPVVFLDRTPYKKEIVSVVIDNYEAAYNITTHLIEQGCRRIMHIGGNVAINIYKERFEGYRKSLEYHGLKFVNKLYFASALTAAAGTEAGKYILKLPTSKRPDAVFAANDLAAVYCMLAVKAEGILIPHDIAFAGFDNEAIGMVVEPNLTTVNYSGDFMGITAANSLINRIQGKGDLLLDEAISLQANIVVRDSSLKNKD